MELKITGKYFFWGKNLKILNEVVKEFWEKGNKEREKNSINYKYSKKSNKEWDKKISIHYRYCKNKNLGNNNNKGAAEVRLKWR